MPPQNLQIEFLNRWRNADRYPADDPLAPQHVPFDYCFAITMMAQPLAWFEATGLPEEAFAIAPLIRAYREHQERIHAGQIFPIGEEPSGTGWTGFQSLRGDEGYLIVYRELNERTERPDPLLELAGRTIACTSVAGHGDDFSALQRMRRPRSNSGCRSRFRSRCMRIVSTHRSPPGHQVSGREL